MKAPISIRPLRDDERRQIKAGLHSSDACVLRRCQILLASERGERAPVIGRQLGCNGQTVRNVINGFNAHGVAVLQEGSSRPHRLRTAFSAENAQRLELIRKLTIPRGSGHTAESKGGHRRDGQSPGSCTAASPSAPADAASG